jgi:predicted RNA-binding Zn-ribbon protein involved in translation (DUF1610 family)
MSIFQRVHAECPGCGEQAEFEAFVSINADRRPDLRAAILDGSFQRYPCPHCGITFRVEPAFTYIDYGRGQYIGAWPVDRREAWAEWAAQTQGAFDRAFGALATGAARELGDTLRLRVTFGWPAFVEKLVAQEAGIDDTTLEVAKVAIVSRLEQAPLPGREELRLVQATSDELTLGWVRAEDHRLGKCLSLPRALLDDIEREPAAWQGLREQVGEGALVDFQRAMLVA